MLRAILLRLAGAIPVLFLVACGIFVLLHLAPGDAASLLASSDAGPEEVEKLRLLWGLDQPLYIQFGKFLLNIMHFDLGVSLRYQQPVIAMIAERLPATLELAAVTLVIAAGIGIPLGVAAALKKGKWIDGLVSMIAVAGVSAPSFWMGILLVLLFSADLHILPSSGRLPYGTPITESTGFYLIDSLKAGQFNTFRLVLTHLTLPAMTLAAGMIGIIARIARSAFSTLARRISFRPPWRRA
jgi:ABC-type dipeptide/oligopeptide/nickel transport system permease component